MQKCLSRKQRRQTKILKKWAKEYETLHKEKRVLVKKICRKNISLQMDRTSEQYKNKDKEFSLGSEEQ